MEDFAAKVIAAHQAGLSEYRIQQQMEREAESHKLNVQQAKLTLDTAKLQQALHERELQAMTSGGPTGQATTTIQSPTTQPANSPLPPPTPMPSTQPQSIQDLLMRGRGQAQTQMAPIPSGQDTSLNTSVPTGVPPAGPDIPVQLSDGRTITVPGTNLEQEQARAVQQFIQQETLKKAFGPNQIVPKGGSIANPSGQIISQGAPDLPALLEEVAAVTPGFETMSGPQKLQAVAAYKQAIAKTATETMQEMDLKTYLKHPELTSKFGADQIGYDKWKQAMAEATAGANKPNPNDARVDKSYQFHTTQFANLSKPVEERVTKFQSLQDSINAGTPLADALIAPTLLSMVSGGVGSGLRMNEAEINRIVGGRSNWETIKAALNKWNTDPNKANSILENQRGQIKSLVAAIGGKLEGKQMILTGAQQQLANSTDTGEHRQIYAKAVAVLSSIDGGGSIHMVAPDGTQRNVAAEQVGHYLSLGAKIK